MSKKREIVWNGTFTKCSFDYYIQNNTDLNELSCNATLSVNDVQVGEMRFVTQIVDMPLDLNPNINTRKYNKIFISYAHQDEKKVKYIAEAYKAQGINYFFDRHYLKGGDVFPLQIQEYINSADLFVLCWSENSKKRTYDMRAVDETQGEEGNRPYALLTYDKYDHVIKTRYFDAGEKPIDGPKGYHMVKTEYTSRGEVSLVRYYDKEKKPVAVNGVYGIKSEYTAYANLKRETCLGKDGKPVVNKEGYAIADYDYDLSNQKTVEKFYKYYKDVDGNPVAASNGAYGISTIYYPETLIHEISFIDQNGNPCNASEGYAIYEYEEDKYGNYTWEAYYDADHASINNAEGYSSVEREFDEKGRPVTDENCMSSVKGLYIIGDCRRGPATVVKGIADAMAGIA